MGTLPFVAGDLAKIAAAAALVKAISPKEPFSSTSEAGPHERR
jgi:biotin transporter BioY